MTNIQSPRRRRIAAFTLVELLVVVGIIAVLISVLLPALSSARKSAMQTRSLSNIRQLVQAYTQYHIENRGQLPYGYGPEKVDGVPLTVQSTSGHTFGSPVSQRYPWRLVSYVSDVWQIIHCHGDAPPLPQAGQSQADAFATAYTLSVGPTYGINSVFLGGHSGIDGFEPNGHPKTTGPAVFKSSQVRNPSRTIVFADAVLSTAGVNSGLSYLSPPRLNGVMWQAESNRCVPKRPGLIMGLPQGRYERGAAVAFFDGHAESLYPGDLADMTLWSPKATSRDWDFFRP